MKENQEDFDLRDNRVETFVFLPKIKVEQQQGSKLKHAQKGNSNISSMIE